MSRVRETSGHRFSVAHVALGAFLALWLAVGVGSAVASTAPAAVKVAGLGLWFAVAIVRSPSFLSLLVSTAWPLILLLPVAFLYGEQVNNSAQYIQGFGYLLIAYSMWCFYSGTQFVRERHLLVLIMLADAFITAWRTLIALQTDPQVARYLATTEENREAVYGSQSFQGLGGYGFAYALPALLIVALYFVAQSHRYRLALVAASLFILVIQFEMAFTTAIVFAVVLGLGLLVRDSIAPVEARLLLYAAAFGGWALGVYAWMLDSLADQTWVSIDVRQRFAELSDLMDGDLAGRSDLGTRLDFWERSLTSFLGGGVFGSLSGNASDVAAGEHSQWLDLLASYGVFALLLGGFFVLAWRKLCQSAAFDVTPVRRSWMYFMLLGFVNPLLYSVIVLTWMFIVPSLASFLSQNSSKIRDPAVVEVVTS